MLLSINQADEKEKLTLLSQRIVKLEIWTHPTPCKLMDLEILNNKKQNLTLFK